MKKLLLYLLPALFLPLAAFTQNHIDAGMQARYGNAIDFHKQAPGLQNPFNRPLNGPYRLSLIQYNQPLINSILFGFNDLSVYQGFRHPSTAYSGGKVWVHQPTSSNRYQWEEKTLCAPAQLAIALPFLIIGHEKLKDRW